MDQPVSEPEKLSSIIPDDIRAEILRFVVTGALAGAVASRILRQAEHDRLGDLAGEPGKVHGPITDE